MSSKRTPGRSLNEWMGTIGVRYAKIEIHTEMRLIGRECWSSAGRYRQIFLLRHYLESVKNI